MPETPSLKEFDISNPVHHVCNYQFHVGDMFHWLFGEKKVSYAFLFSFFLLPGKKSSELWQAVTFDAFAFIYLFPPNFKIL